MQGGIAEKMSWTQMGGGVLIRQGAPAVTKWMGGGGECRMCLLHKRFVPWNILYIIKW